MLLTVGGVSFTVCHLYIPSVSTDSVPAGNLRYLGELDFTTGGRGPLLSDCALVCRLSTIRAGRLWLALGPHSPVLANTQLRQAGSTGRHAGEGCAAFSVVRMQKAPARVLVTLLLLLLGTAATCSSVAGRQGDSPDAPQLRKLLQSKPNCTCMPLIACNLLLTAPSWKEFCIGA